VAGRDAAERRAGRKKRRAKFEADNPSKKYGVGFAHVQRGVGTGADAGVA
jgi:hypothetical protein